MYSRKTIFASMALVSALGAGAPALAQGQTINGMAVPADQIQAVQDKCNELNDAGGGASTTGQAPAQGANTSAGAGGAVAGDAAGGAASTAGANGAGAGASVSGDAGGVAAGSAGSGSATATANDGAGGASSQIDLAKLTPEICSQGGFNSDPHGD